MDPLSILSIAGNVVQFLEFGLRVVSKGCRIYRSIDGCLAENLDLEIVTSDLLVLQNKLQRTCSTTKENNTMSEDERALGSLCTRCGTLAERLLGRLNMAKAQGRLRKWKSLRQALKSVWSKADIEDMARRLEDFRSELNLRIMVSLRSGMDLESSQLSEMSNQLDSSAQRILTAVKENRDIFETSLAMSVGKIKDHLDQAKPVMMESNDDYSSARSTYLPDRSCSLNSRSTSSQNHDLHNEVILSGLKYEGMHDRYEAVVDAHANTFSWIFESSTNSSWDDFALWIQRGAQIYWINGKAASGKSTLMRYIFHHQKFDWYLRAWNGGKRLITAKFYFWSTGTTIQKSQIGLFRSLLHQILESNQDLIPKAFPTLWKHVDSFKYKVASSFARRLSWRSWSLEELKTAFHRVLQETTTSARFCLLIDGLDEFDGDHMELATFFKSFAMKPHIKFCLSSRPLLIYEQTLGMYPKLRLQDLTIGDITRYVSDSLSAHPRFCVLAYEEHHDSLDLIKEIVQTSAGVFLWVTLVVKSILKGLTNHDRIVDLQKRLRELPPELDELYSLMLRSVTPAFYLTQASRLLQLVYQSPAPISLLCLTLADEDDLSLPIRSRLCNSPDEEMLRRAEAMIPRIKSRCAGLLEVEPVSLAGTAKSTVRYLHLTVREFLEKPDVWMELLALTNAEGFDATSALLRAHVVMLKIYSPPWEIALEAIETAIGLARRSENSTGTAQTALLDELDRTASEFAPKDRLNWVAQLHSADQPCLRCPESFLTFAVSNGLTLYVKSKITGHPHMKPANGQRSLLEYATWHQAWYVNPPTVSPEMVAMLLQNGLHPNEPSAGSTPWRSLIRYIGRKLEHDSDTDNQSWNFDHLWHDVCKLFLLSGADINVHFKSRGTRQSLEQVFEQAFGHLPPNRIHELKHMISHGKGQETRKKSGNILNQNRFRHDQSIWQRAGHDNHQSTLGGFHTISNDHPPMDRYGSRLWHRAGFQQRRHDVAGAEIHSSWIISSNPGRYRPY